MAELLYEIKDGIGWIRFNRPEILNAFNPEEARALVATLRQGRRGQGSQGDHHLQRRRGLFAPAMTSRSRWPSIR